MAQALLSGVYANTGQSALAPAFSRRAFELRDSVSERERFFISWRYYRDAMQDWDKALELARSWTATYPREAFAFNSLGSAFIRLGQFEQSVEAVSRSDPARSRSSSRRIRTWPRRCWRSIGSTRRGPSFSRRSTSTSTSSAPAACRISSRSSRATRRRWRGSWSRRSACAKPMRRSAGRRITSAFAGRIEAAHEQFRRGIQMSLQGNFQEVAAQLTMEDAETHASVGQCAEARSEVARGSG